jgi:hypothetical protein
MVTDVVIVPPPISVEHDLGARYRRPVTDPDPLELAACALATGDLRSETLPDLAVDALLRGIDSPSLLMLAGQHRSDVRDSADLFRSALAELGIDVPDRQTALWTHVRTTAQAMCDGTVAPAVGTDRIWMLYLDLEDNGDLRIFAGLGSELDSSPDDAAIGAQMVAEAAELLQRPGPRVWFALTPRAGGSPLTRTTGDGRRPVDVAYLPLTAGLVADVQAWNAEYQQLLGRWPEAGGFPSEAAAVDHVESGAALVSRLQDELGAGYHVEYVPEPVRGPNVKLARGRSFRRPRWRTRPTQP